MCEMNISICFFFLKEKNNKLTFLWYSMEDAPVYQRKYQNNGIFITLSEMH